MAPHKFLYRPLSLLYPIECPDHKEDSDHKEDRVNVCQGGGNDSLVNSDDNDSEDIIIPITQFVKRQSKQDKG